MRSITNERNLEGKKILLRLDLNVPLEKEKISDTTRIDKILPTLNFLLQEKTKIIIPGSDDSGLKTEAKARRRPFAIIFFPFVQGIPRKKEQEGSATGMVSESFKNSTSSSPITSKWSTDSALFLIQMAIPPMALN